MTFTIEHEIEWPLGNPPRVGDDMILVSVQADWDPADDRVLDATYSISMPFQRLDRMPRVLEQVRAQLQEMMDHALTAAIDNAKEERRAV